MLQALKSTRILTPHKIIDGYIVFDKVIREITASKPAPDVNIIDVGNKVVMPGIIDPHVHINEPGRTEWEGFDTATRAAMVGGITSLIEMPLNASPVTTTVDAFRKKCDAADNKLHVHCGFWGGVIPGNENQVEPLIEQGIFGFKAFLVHSGIDEFPQVSEADLRKVMPILAKHHLPLLVHCELINEEPGEIDAWERNDSYKKYLASRPKKWEDDAIALMIRLCEEYNCRTHIVHLSSANSIDQIFTAKMRGLPLTVETAQHYLFFNAENIPDGRTEYKCAPPIREKANNDLLWQALKDGIIDFVATDHSPAPPGMKEINSGDLMKAWGGIASIQFSLSALWTVARRKGCTIIDLQKWLCTNPALLPGLKSKGRLEKGMDADLVVWDPDKNFIVKDEMIRHRHKITPYINEELCGVVEQTWIGGKQIFAEGNILHLNRGKILLR